jgi:hypothetical protein
MRRQNRYCGHAEEKEMPKASRATAAEDIGASDSVEEVQTRLGEFVVCFDSYSEDGDAGMERWELARKLGAVCLCPHWGYVLKGKKGFRFADHEEIYEAGDAYYAPPGHVPLNFPGGETVEFAPAALRDNASTPTGGHGATPTPSRLDIEQSVELVVDVLSATELVPQDLLAGARGRARKSGSVGTALVEAGIASSEGIAHMLALRHRMPFVDLADIDVDEDAAKLIPRHVLERVEAIAYALEYGTLQVAIADPSNLYHIDALRFASRHPLELAVGTRDDILAAIGKLVHAPEA